MKTKPAVEADFLVTLPYYKCHPHSLRCSRTWKSVFNSDTRRPLADYAATLHRRCRSQVRERRAPTQNIGTIWTQYSSAVGVHKSLTNYLRYICWSWLRDASCHCHCVTSTKICCV